MEHTALVIALVKQINRCYQKCSSNTGSSKQNSKELLDEVSQHEAEEQLSQRKQQ